MDEGEQKQGSQGPDLSSLGQNVYQGGRLIQKGAQIGARALPLFANPVTVAIIAVVVVTILVVILSNQGAAGGLPSQTPLPASVCTSDNPNSCLLRDFNIDATGFPEIYARQVYEAFSIAYNQSSNYRQLWNNGGRKLVLKYDKPPIWGERNINTCTGQAETAGDYVRTFDVMYLWNMDRCSLTTGNAYLIIHETGHILADRNTENIFNKFPYKALPEQDTQCYKENGFLKTYIGEGPYVQAEDFAESVAEYVLYRSWETTAGLTNFPQTCKNTYQWMRDYVFGVDITPPAGL